MILKDEEMGNEAKAKLEAIYLAAANLPKANLPANDEKSEHFALRLSLFALNISCEEAYLRVFAVGSRSSQ